jgi:D-tyrosyl-tRNA(Tyr) deacylase
MAFLVRLGRNSTEVGLSGDNLAEIRKFTGISTMIGLLQRVSCASVAIQGATVAAIGRGLLVLVGVKPEDSVQNALGLVSKLLKYRVFPDVNGKMNLDLTQIDGAMLLVPQFTLAADTRHGLRPGFSTAAPPEHGRVLFEAAVQAARGQHPKVATGVFGADMQVSLVNDGPVTLWLES